MKTSRRFALLGLLLAGLVATPGLQAVPEILLYPFARAFGSPPEAELARCRVAFSRLAADWNHAHILVLPVWQAGLQVEPRPENWRQDLAFALARGAGAPPGRFRMADAAPAVAPMEMGHNQLRYLWQRAELYRRWVQESSPAADYVWCLELLGPPDHVVAIQVYIFDRSGQIAYCRLYNSHQFGRPALTFKRALGLVIHHLREDLQRDPLAVFPPYGVG